MLSSLLEASFSSTSQNSSSCSVSCPSVTQVLDTVLFSQLPFGCMWHKWASWVNCGCACVIEVWGREEGVQATSVLF